MLNKRTSCECRAPVIHSNGAVFTEVENVQYLINVETSYENRKKCPPLDT